MGIPQQSRATIDEQLVIMHTMAEVLEVQEKMVVYGLKDPSDLDLARWTDIEVAAAVSESLYGKANIFKRLQAILARVEYNRHHITVKGLKAIR